MIQYNAACMSVAFDLLIQYYTACVHFQESMATVQVLLLSANALLSESELVGVCFPVLLTPARPFRIRWPNLSQGRGRRPRRVYAEYSTGRSVVPFDKYTTLLDCLVFAHTTAR
jgi:hypothetical protein